MTDYEIWYRYTYAYRDFDSEHIEYQIKLYAWHGQKYLFKPALGGRNKKGCFHFDAREDKYNVIGPPYVHIA